MCTAVTFSCKNHYFGRNLDLEFSLNEEVLITPRRFPFRYRNVATDHYHNAFIGMGIIADGFPLYYDATNEHGLSVAALNFPQNAVYHEHADGFYNIAPFEFIPWILCQCKTVADAEILLSKTNIVQEDYSEIYRSSPLHWIIADKNSAITVESVTNELKVYRNNVGILTNNPTFDYHLVNLENYLNLTSNEPINRFSENLDLKPYSLGMGAFGLPGDFSSTSRFVRAAFIKFNSRCNTTESAAISQFFHILGSVSQPDGSTKTGNGYERTVYSSCCNTDKGIYYYTTYENSQITAVSMFSEDLDLSKIRRFPLVIGQQIRWINT
jgi:choloylglycine hydrolase